MEPDVITRWWGALRDPVAFIVGVNILGYETVVEQGDRPYLIAAAIICLGLPAAAWVGRVFDKKE